MPLHFIMRSGHDISLPVVLREGGLEDLQVKIATAAHYRADALDFVSLEIEDMRIAIRADELIAVYSEEAGRIVVRHPDPDKRLRVERDDAGRVAGVVAS